MRTARERAFVGREAEIARLDAAVRGDPGSPSICFLHGPGGIGKSALLRRVADSARGAGRPVVELDGRFLEPSTRAFEDAAAEVVDRARAVLLVDTFERCAWSQSWLRDRFLPGLRDDVLVVLAGREPPELEWSLDPGWSDVLCVLALEPLDRAHAAAVLTAGGVDASRRDAVIRFAGGNPLALSLAVAVAAAHEGDDGLWQPSAQVLDTLLARLVGDVPSGAHRRALEATAQTFRMTVELLRVAVAGDDAAELFDWLRGLPFVESSAHGLHPHDAARAALVADLRWRDAGTFDAVRTRLSAHLLQQIRAVSEDEALSAMRELWYLYRGSPGVAAASAWEAHGRVQHEPLGPDDLATAMAAAARADGPETAELVRYWFDRRPGAFGLYRSVRTGRPVAFCARLQLTAPVEQRDAERDPVVAAVREYCGDHVERGRQVAMTRFLVTLDDGEHAAHVASAVRWRSLAGICRSPALAHGLVVRRETDPVEAWLGSTMTPLDARPVVDGRAHRLLASDWRTTSFEQWFRTAVEGDRTVPAPVPARSAPDALPRESFDDAVRQALLLWRQPDGLRSSRLASTPLVPVDADPVDAAVRAVVRQALEDMRVDPRGLRGHDAVTATYLSGAPTQQAAARRLGVPFSTYRRHLKQGVQDLCDRLWSDSSDRPLAHRPRLGG